MTMSANGHPSREWFGHPRGLATLFFTEMWERFSYYGMRALLVLFMTDAARGGLGMSAQDASAVYGLYTFGVYALAIPGGWVADRLIGKRRAVLYGGIVIALGHYCLAVQSPATFWAGLSLIVLGTGLLKPNVSAVVGDLYPEGGARRDAGFSIFYSGINVGAFLGQAVCPFLGEKLDWHWGFGAAAVGMTLGVVQYVAGQRHLEGAGGSSEEPAASRARALRRLAIGSGLFAALLALAAGLIATGRMGFVDFVEALGQSVAALVTLYFVWLVVFACRDAAERGRVAVCAVLFLGAAVFWAGFEQAGSSMNLFARDHTDRVLFGWQAPAGWLQNVNPFLIVLLAPVVGQLWVWVGRRNPSIPVKFGLGMILLGLGFLVLGWGSAGAVGGAQVGMRWLVVTYFFHTIGELCLSPVGLSSITKLSPQRLVGQMMGTWFMGAAIGNLIAGLVGGYVESMPMPRLFGAVGVAEIAAGLAFVLLARPIRRLAGGIR